jgi:hypothetical protein
MKPPKQISWVVLAVIVLSIVATLLMMFFPRPAHAEPSSLKSLQPFQKFAAGEGVGVATEYSPRSKEQFVTLLRDKARAQKEMRVSCEVLVRQMVEAHPGLPFEGCEGAAAAIEHDNSFAVIACQDDMFVKNYLTVTNPKATSWGVWHRKCLPREQVLVYKGQPLVSTMCLNVVVPPAVLPLQSKLAVASLEGACPEVFTLKVNVWQRAALSLPGVEETHAKEERGTKMFSDAKVSRKHGKQFRDAYAEWKLKRSSAERAFRVSFIMTPESQMGSPEITKEEILGDIAVTGGLRELQFTRGQLEQWDAIRIIAVNGDVVSPPRFNGSGLKEIRFFNHLPGKKLGEWQNNPVPDCIMNEHWIE